MSILVIGYFGFETNQLDGQTVKTRNVYTMLKSRLVNVVYFDVQSLHCSKVSVFKMFCKLLKARIIVIIPAGNALKWIFPMVFAISKVCFKEIIFIPVGGWLSWFLKDKKNLQRMISKVKAVLPQTTKEVDALRGMYGWKHVEYFPNFRIAQFDNAMFRRNETLRLVFFARIHKMKGLDVVFYVADKLRQHAFEITIDFYGQINEPDRQYFEEELARNPNTKYKGFLHPDQIYDVLRQYDVLLFPTRYIQDEGFPGTILDGYMSGIPVIASNWCHANEFVRDGYCGFVCDINDLDSFYDKVIYLNNNREVLAQMKRNAYNESKKYSDAAAFEIIKKYL